MTTREKTQAEKLIGMIPINLYRPMLNVDGETISQDNNVKKTFNAVRRALKEFSPKHKTYARHIVDRNGCGYIELKQGNMKRFVRSFTHIQTSGACWSGLVWMKMLAGQKMHTQNMLKLDRLMSTLPNVVFDTSRMNVLYYPYIKHSFIYIDDITSREDELNMMKDYIRLKTTSFGSLLADDGWSLADFDPFKWQADYLKEFSWVESEPDNNNFLTLYNEGAGEELFAVLHLNDIMRHPKYSMNSRGQVVLRDKLRQDIITLIPEDKALLDKPLYDSRDIHQAYKAYVRNHMDWFSRTGVAEYLLKKEPA